MKNNYNSNFSYTEEELENQKKEALKEINKLHNEMIKERKKKIIITSLVIIASFVLFKIFIGQIDINSPNIANQHKNRLYQVSLNDEIVTVGVEEIETKTIIPFILYLKHTSSHSFLGKDSLNYKLGEKITMDVKSFECYAENLKYPLSCVSDSGNLIKKEKNDLEYYLHIKKNSRGEKVFYDGNFVNDLSDYLTEKGNYHISIEAKYKNVKSIIYFNLKIE